MENINILNDQIYKNNLVISTIFLYILLFFFILERVNRNFYDKNVLKIHFIISWLIIILCIFITIFAIYYYIKDNHIFLKLNPKDKVKIDNTTNLSLIESLKNNSYENVKKIVNSKHFDKSIIYDYHYIHEAMLMNVDYKVINLLFTKGNYIPNIDLHYENQYNENTLFVAFKKTYNDVISHIFMDIVLAKMNKKETLKIVNNVNIDNESLFYVFITKYFYSYSNLTNSQSDELLDWFVSHKDLYLSKEEFVNILNLHSKIKLTNIIQKIKNINIIKKNEYINYFKNNESILTIFAKRHLYEALLLLLDINNLEINNYINSSNHKMNFVNIIFENMKEPNYDLFYDDRNIYICEIIKKLYVKKYKFHDEFIKMVLESKNKEFIKIVLENELKNNNVSILNKKMIKYIFEFDNNEFIINLIHKNDFIKNNYLKYICKKVKKYNVKKINQKNIDFLTTYLQFYKNDKKKKKEKECVICLETEYNNFIKCKKCKHTYHISCLTDYFNSCKDDKCCYCRNSVNFALLN